MESDLAKKSGPRFAYLDNVRFLVIILVIAMHTAVTYSGIGGWYYKEGALEELSMFEMVFFAFGQSFLQSWFMGILFFVSALFIPRALAKRGLLDFIKERLFRLGLPLLLYVFVVNPFILLVLLGINAENSFFANYAMYITNFWWTGGTGPLWFAETLLIFSVVYAVIKKIFAIKFKITAIKTINIIFIIILTAVIAFLVRLVFPIDTSFFNLQFCYFTSYIVMFIAGTLIGENDLLEKLTEEKNIKWISISLLAGIPLWAAAILLGGALDGTYYFKGGFHWQSMIYALWESLIAIGFSLGLIALFKKRANTENKFNGLARDNAFGIYFFHAPILITVSLALKNLVLIPFIKFIIVTIIAAVASFLFTCLVRKIKPIGVLLK